MATVRPQSLAEQSGGGGPTTATNVGGSSRAALIMTSAQSRRVSMSHVAPSTISRAYENTYQTEPNKAFTPAAARKIIRETLENFLEGRKYEAGSCTQLSRSIADVIKQRVKELGHSRYKLVAVVAIGQAEESSVAFSSRCVWNVSYDSFAEYTYRNSSLFAIGLLYALYCE